jgi:hypothetical protein
MQLKKLKSVFYLFFVLGLVLTAGLVFTACDNAASPTGADTHFKIVDANNQFVGFLIEGDDDGFLVYRPQLNGSDYYPTGIFEVDADGLLDVSSGYSSLYFTESGGKGDPYSADTFWSYLVFRSSYNADTDEVDAANPTLYTWASMDSDGLPADTPVTIEKGSSYGGLGLSDFDYSSTPRVAPKACKLKIITQKELLGIDIKGPVKIGG